MKKLLLLTTLLVASVDVSASALTQKSLDALRKYCIPDPSKPTDDGLPVCGSEFEGKYNSRRNTCDCYSSYLKWDANLRRCVVKCSTGSFPRNLKSSETDGKKCPLGYAPSVTIDK